MCGKKVKLHPFFNPLKGLWGNIESLRHIPPCLCPPRLSFFSRPFPVDCTVSSDGFESQTSFGNVTIFQHSDPYRESFSEERQAPESVISPCFSDIGHLRSTVHVFDDSDADHLHSPCYVDSDFSSDFPQDTFLFKRIDPSFSLDTNKSSARPFPSTASLVHIFHEDGTKQFPLPNPEDLEFIPYNEHALNKFESSFNDSGLHLPESLGDKKDDTTRKPIKLQVELESEVSNRYFIILKRPKC